MNRVYLALGSNVGNSWANIDHGTILLSAKITRLEEAPRYLSRAAGFTDQSDFLNTAVAGETELTPQELLVFCQSIEVKVGRIRRFHWGPRELDIDILLYNQLVLDEPNLVIPHPRLNERDFMLQPLVDLAPELVDPKTQTPFADILQQLPSESRSVKKISQTSE